MKWTKRRRAVVLALVFVAVAMLCVVQGVGMGAVVPWALERYTPAEWSVSVADARGSWVSHIRLTGLEAVGPGTSLSADSVVVAYRVLPLLRRTIAVRSLSLGSTHLQTDLTVGDTPPDDEGDGLRSWLFGSPLGAWTLDAGSIHVDRLRADVVTTEGRYQIEDARVAVAARLGPDALRLVVDTLGAAIQPPAVVDSAGEARSLPPGRLTVRGSLEGGALDLAVLEFISSRSSVQGQGRLTLTPAQRLVDYVDFALRADPLDLRDLPVEWPEPVREDPAVTVDVVADGALDSLALRARASALGTAQLEARLVARVPSDTKPEPEPHLSGTLELRDFDLSPWSSPPFDGRVDGHAEVAVSELSAQGRFRAAGSLTHTAGTGPPGSVLARDLRADYTVVREPPEPDGSGAVLVGETRVYLATTTGDWVEAGTIEARGEGQRADWSIDVRLDDSQARGRGSVAWAEVPELGIERLDLSRFDLRSIQADLPGSALSGRISGRMRGAVPYDVSGRLRADLTASSLDGRAADSVALAAELAPSTARGRLLVRDSITRLDVAYRATVRPPVGSGPANGGLDGTLTVAFDSSTVAATRLRDGDLAVERTGNRIRARGTLEVLDRAVTPLALRATADLRGTAVEDLTGTAELSARRARSVPSGSEEAERSPLVDSLTATVRSVEAGRFTTSGYLYPGEGGRFEIDGSGELREGRTVFDVSATGSMTSPRALGETTIDSLSARASGTRNADEWEELAFAVRLRGADWRGIVADSVLARGRLTEAGLRVDSLYIDSNLLTAEGRGVLPRDGAAPDSIRVRASLVDLEPIRALTGAEVFGASGGSFEGLAVGTLGGADLTASLNVAALLAGSTRTTGLSVHARAQLPDPRSDPLDLRAGRIVARLDQLTLPDAEVRAIDVVVEGDRDSLTVEAAADVDDRRRATMFVRVDPHPDRRTARIDRFEAQLDRDTWRLVQPSVFSYRDGYSLRSFLLRASGQEILVDGGVSADGALDLVLAMDSTDIGTVSDFAGLPNLRGWLEGRVELAGTRAVPRGRAEISGAAYRQGARPGPVAVLVEFDSSRVDANVELENPTGGRLRLDGSARLLDRPSRQGAAPAEGSVGALRPFEDLDVTISAEAFRASWAVPFLDPTVLTDVDGRLDGTLTVLGSGNAPTLGGSFELQNGTARMPQLGIRLQRLVAFTSTSGSQLVVDSARAVSGDGRIRTSGTVGLSSELPLDLQTRLDGFEAIRNESYRATVSGDLRTRGTFAAPVVDGTINVERLDVHLDERISEQGLEEVELTEEDLLVLRERFGYVPPEGDAPLPLLARLTADLVVSLGRDSWLRKRANPEMAVAFTGDLNVSMRPGEEPRLQGSVETIADRGFVEQFGRRFRLREGSVTFDGPADAAALDISAVYTVPSRDNPRDAEATIILQIEGTQERLALTLSSEPPMENADIISYIATGRPAAASLTLNETGATGGLVAAGADLALSQVVGVVEGAAAQSVGLDVVEIRREGFREATLVAGKYVSPRLYIGFAKPITLREAEGISQGTAGESEVEIEIEALRWLLINIEGSGSVLRLFLRGRYAY